MRIFKANSTRSIAIESVIGVAATLGLAAAFGAPHFGLAAIEPHPVWLVVLVIAARYGTRGLAIVIAVAWGALAIANGNEGPGRVLDTLSMPLELGALAGTVLVGWITSGNERRERALAGKVAELERRVTADSKTIGDLRRAALALRARNDRLDLSLTFLRNIARRLHGSDAEAAAQAALELVVARIGARAASVELLSDDGGLRSLAALGIWNREGPDRTVLATVSGRQPTRGLELAEGGPGDSDIAAPIIDAAGAVRGAIAARGVPGGGSSMAALRDLSVITDWASPALCDAQPEARPEAGDGEAEVAIEAESESETGESSENESTALTISPAHA